MPSLHIPAGTDVTQLRQRSGLSDAQLEKLLDRSKIDDGVVTTSFDVSVGDEFSKGGELGALVAAMQDSAGTDPAKSATAARLAGPLDDKPTATGVAQRLTELQRALQKVGARARDVFDSPSNRPPPSETISLFDQLRDLRTDTEAQLVAANTLATTLKPCTQKRKRLNDAIRPALAAVAVPLEHTMNALPRRFDVAPPDGYFKTYRFAIKNATDPNVERSVRDDAFASLEGLFEGLRGTAEAVANASDEFGESVEGERERLVGLTREIYAKIGRPAKDSFKELGARRDMDGAAALIGSIASALEAADDVAASTRPLLDALTEAGDGAKSLHAQLTSATHSASWGALLTSTEDAFNALPHILRATPPQDYWKRYRAHVDELRDPSTRGAAWAALTGLYEVMHSQATAIETAQSDFGDRVRQAKDNLREARTERLGAPRERYAAATKNGANVAASRQLWTDAKAVVAGADEIATAERALLSELSAAGEGAKHLHDDLRWAINDATRTAPRELLAEVVQALPNRTNVWEVHRLKDERELVAAATDPSAEGHTEAIAALESWVDEVLTRASAIASAEEKFGGRVKATLDELRAGGRALRKPFDSALQDKTPHFNAAVAVWARALEAPAEGRALAARADALIAELRETPGAERFLREVADAAEAAAVYPANHALRKVLDALPKLMGLTFYRFLSEGARNEMVRSAVDPKGTEESRQAGLQKLQDRFAELESNHRNLHAAESEFRGDIDGLRDEIHTTVERWRHSLASPINHALHEGADTPDPSAAHRLWGGAKAAISESHQLAAKVDALEAKLEARGDGTQKLKIDLSNARAEAVHTPERILQELFSVLPSLFGLPRHERMGEWKRHGLAGDATDLSKPGAVRDQAVSAFEADFARLVKLSDVS